MSDDETFADALQAGAAGFLLKGSTVGVGTADGAEVSFARAILADAGLTEGEDYEFLAIGDGGMAATAFLRDDVESYAAAVSDAAILESRGIPLREITPEEYLSYFGNGYAALRSYIEENPELSERAIGTSGGGRCVRRHARRRSESARIVMPAHLCQLASLRRSGETGRSLMKLPTSRLAKIAAASSQCRTIAVVE